MWEKKGKIRRTRPMTKKRSSEIFTLKMEIFSEIGPRKKFLVPPKCGARSPPMLMMLLMVMWMMMIMMCLFDGQVTMSDRKSTEQACLEPNPIIDGRKANVNLAYLGAKPRIPAAELLGMTSFLLFHLKTIAKLEIIMVIVFCDSVAVINTSVSS